MDKQKTSCSYGLIIEKPLPEDYVFGSATKIDEKIINSSGDWTDFLPEIEYQKKNGVETMSCVSFGTLSIIEILAKYIYGIEWNRSDRFTSIMSETGANGNTPNKVAQSIRHHGTIREKFLPFDENVLTFDDYMTPVPMKPKYLVFGAKWASKWNINHSWVNNTPDEIREALKRSPLGVSVNLSKQRDGVYYKDEGDKDNHWTVLFKIKENGMYKIYDTYDKIYKTLRADYKFQMIKGYALTKKSVIIKKYWFVELYENLISFIKDMLWKLKI